MKKVLTITLVISCLMPVLLSQQNFLQEEYRYFPGTLQPADDWNSLQYNDSAWQKGFGAIGYGDVVYKPHFIHPVNYSPPMRYEPGDTMLQTIVPAIESLYLRYPFIIEPQDTVGISGMALEAYFDDGFIAYLNGVEFARSNMGTFGDTVFFNTLADRSHESPLATGDPQPNTGYYINRTFLEHHLRMGENILAIELHNDSVDGSDLFLEAAFYPCLRDTSYDSYIELWSPPEGDWPIHIRNKACVAPDSTTLPIVLIESDEFGIPVSHFEVIAAMKIIDKETGLNHPDDTSYTYNGRIRIEVRGGSSRSFPKQPFNIETQQSDGSNNNVSLMGMPAENDWRLIGPISDRTLLRNTFTYELGRKQGHWEPRSKYCELILNGEYLGLYVFTEKIKPDKNRLDISKLSPTDLYGNEVSGGYIFWAHNRDYLTHYYPKYDNIMEEQETYLDKFVERYREAMFSNNFLDPQDGYLAFVNTESAIDYLIVNELSFDHDKYGASTYMYKDRSDKDSLICFGPLWDYNYAYGNTNECLATDQWRFQFGNNNPFKRLVQDTVFRNRFAAKWHEQRNSFLHTDSLYALIDSLTHHFAEARKRDSMVWEAYTTVNVYFAKDTVYRYDQVIQNFKTWIGRRVTWIDTYIDSINIPLTIYAEPEGLPEQNLSLRVYPNPFHDHIRIELFQASEGALFLELINMQGQRVALREVRENIPTGIEWHLDENLPPGVYQLNIWNKGKPAGSSRVVKD